MIFLVPKPACWKCSYRSNTEMSICAQIQSNWSGVNKSLQSKASTRAFACLALSPLQDYTNPIVLWLMFPWLTKQEVVKKKRLRALPRFAPLCFPRLTSVIFSLSTAMGYFLFMTFFCWAGTFPSFASPLAFGNCSLFFHNANPIFMLPFATTVACFCI